MQLARIYDEPDFVPPVPELVQVHMVFSIIYYQYGVRNWQETERRDQLNDLSNKHYHFSLSKFFDLMTSRDLAAIQAMVLMACHTRAFPKPGCGTLVSNLAFQRALELNLHRAPQIPLNGGRPPNGGTNLTIEMRKRTWWVLISMYVSVTGRRGRPMPITVEEFDVPIPEPVNDELLTEDGVDTSQNLPYDWEVGMAMFKMVPLLMEMYSNIYSVRRDAQNYPKVIYALEEELRKWEDELPQSLKFNPDEPQNNVAALYTRQFGLEMRLWMRHNSVNPASDKKMMAENTRVCEETARELLYGVQQMIANKSLDTTWTAMAVYSMSIFSMLVAHWERRYQTTPDQVAMLRREMDDWMEVLKEASQLLCTCLRSSLLVAMLTMFTGCGSDLQDEIGGIIDRTIAWIEHDMQHQGTKPPPQPAAPAVRLKKEHSAPDIPVGQIPAPPSDPNHISTAPPSSTVSSQQASQQQALPPHPQTGPQADRAYYTDSNLNGHTAYTGLAYGDQTQQGTHLATQPYNADSMFYSNSQQAAAAAAEAAVVSGSEAHPNPLNSFASQATQQHVDPDNQFYWPRTGGNAWQDWTAAVVHNQDRYGAGALLSLGATGTTTASAPRLPMPSLADGTSGPEDMASQWPLVMFGQHPQPEPQRQRQHQRQHQHQHQHQPHPHPHNQHQHHPHHPHGATGA